MGQDSDLLRGIDVSGWQGHVDWSAVAAAGYAFGSCKLTEGLTVDDRTGADNLRRIRTAGMRAVAYHYLRGNDPEAEAAHFLARLGDAIGPDAAALPPVRVMLDVEDASAGPGAADRALAWLRAVEDARGLRPFVYTYPGFAFLHHFERAPDLGNYSLWIAHYGVASPLVPKPWADWSLWQQTGRHRAPGVPTLCDLDVARPGAFDD